MTTIITDKATATRMFKRDAFFRVVWRKNPKEKKNPCRINIAAATPLFCTVIWAFPSDVKMAKRGEKSRDILQLHWNIASEHPSLNVSHDLLTNIPSLKRWYQVHYVREEEHKKCISSPVSGRIEMEEKKRKRRKKFQLCFLKANTYRTQESMYQMTSSKTIVGWVVAGGTM